MPPKILVISNYRDTNSSRPEAEIFIGLAQKGWDVDIMTYGDAAYVARFREAGIRVIDFHPEKKFDSEAVSFIRQHLTDGGYDILQLYNSKAYFNGIRAAKGLPVKLVFYRGTQMNIHWYDPSLYAKYFHPRVDAIICNSRSVEDTFRRQSVFPLRKRVVTINKGHDPAWYAGTGKADLQKFGVPEGSFVFTCIANAQPVKGIRYLLEAMKLLPEGMDISLLMVGRGMDTDENRRLAAESGYEERIFFTGFRPDPHSIDRASNILICPSIGAESLTKAVVEAMSLGLAPIITNIPGNRYLVEHAKTGLVIPPKNPKALADAMQAVYRKRVWADAMGRHAKERITARLNISKTVEEMAEFYEDLASGNPTYQTKRGML